MERKHLAGIDEAMATRLLNSMNLGEPMPVAAVWLNHLLNQEARTYEKGESLRFPTASWSLAKCQLVQRRLQASRRLVNCWCLPETAFMPNGCPHKNTEKEPGYSSCPLCDWCLRCQKMCRHHAKDRATRCTCSPSGMDGHGFRH